ncbi:hypothetical protein H5410_038100 [Solanum commersonii]|uniref:Uncharacterized protein n=1 Tax=Solanum commersonii TaxID=4109 RepID=A0A9J5YC45_SOLCO|nr:hypothetical protein H5410_038100 [Solanum commersonii]
MQPTLQLLNTYLISTAKVKVLPTSYGKPIHKFHWILDKETVIEQIKASHEVEKPLPPPTKLNITSFDRIPHLMKTCDISIWTIYADILAIVLRCGPQKNAGRSHHRCREMTLCDNQAKENKTMLLGSPSATTSTSSSITPMIVTPARQQIISIAEISSAPSRQSLSLTHVHEMLSNKEFEIQLRKSSWGSSNTTNASLSILSYMEKQLAPESTTDRTPKKIKPLETSEVEVMATTTIAGPSNAPAKFEPPTPTKKV